MNKDGILEELESILASGGISYSMKRSCQQCIEILSEEEELQLQINLCTSILDKAAQSSNINPWVRTKLWTIVSKLESLSD